MSSIDFKLATAIISAYGSANRIPSTREVDPDMAREICAAIAPSQRVLLWTNALFVSRNSRFANHRRTAQFFDSAG
eukprot:6455163-Prymnesium_polylepis.1